MTEFILDLATLRPTLNRVEVEAPAREVGLPESDWPGGIRAEFRVERSGERVSVRGKVTSSAHLECVSLPAGVRSRGVRRTHRVRRAVCGIEAQRAGRARARRLHAVSRRASAGPARYRAGTAAARVTHLSLLPGGLPGAVPEVWRRPERRTVRMRGLTPRSGPGPDSQEERIMAVPKRRHSSHARQEAPHRLEAEDVRDKRLQPLRRPAPAAPHLPQLRLLQGRRDRRAARAVGGRHLDHVLRPAHRD